MFFNLLVLPGAAAEMKCTAVMHHILISAHVKTQQITIILPSCRETRSDLIHRSSALAAHQAVSLTAALMRFVDISVLEAIRTREHRDETQTQTYRTTCLRGDLRY